MEYILIAMTLSYIYIYTHMSKWSLEAPLFYLQNNAKIRKILTQLDAEKLVHAFLLLGYCN